jgi:hypothetical protein
MTHCFMAGYDAIVATTGRDYITRDEQVLLAQHCGMRNAGNHLFATQHPRMVRNADGTRSRL